MYLDELKATARRTTAITIGVVLITTSIAAWPAGWRALPGLFRYNLTIGVFVGLLFWLCPPLIDAYSRGLSPLWQWCFRIVAWAVVMNAGFACGLAVMATMGSIPWASQSGLFWQSLLPNTLIATICCSAFAIHEGTKYRLQYEVAQARLESLEARLHPHFLFNALNSVAALIPENPALAESMTEKIADLLRYSLDSAPRRTVRLEQELKVMTDYLEIERTRFGDRLCYSVDVPPGLMHMAVPPFCLQTLVENSVKHGGSEIRVQGKRADGKLILTVWDSGQGFGGRQKEIPGHGLHDLRQRLSSLWGNDAALEYSQAPGGSVVELSLPCKAYK